MRNIILFFFILAALTSCKKDLSGHWHAKMEKFEYKLDIEKNGNCYWVNYLTDEPVKGKHIKSENRIEIYGESCGVYNFDYEIKDNIVYIKNSSNKKIILERRPNCNKINDFTTELSIDFLKGKDIFKDSIMYSELNEYINIGFSKKNKTILIESWKLDKLKTLNNIDSLTSKIEKNRPKQEIPYLNYILTPDKNIEGKKLNKVINTLKKSGKKKIYIRTLKDSFSSTDRNIFEYIRLSKHNFDFESDKVLNEIIK
jgi:hypothetical protein